MRPTVPPAIVFMLHLGLAWLIDTYIGFGRINFKGQEALAICLFLAGTGVILMAILTMFRARTTVDPISPDRASKLVTNGIFKLSRNPIYLGLLWLLLSWIIWLGSMPSMLLGATFVWYMSTFQIRAEEVALEKNFGDDFSSYKNQVRRWL